MSWFSGMTYKFFTDDVVEKCRANNEGSKDKANADVIPPQEFSDMLINGAKELVNGTVVCLVAPIAEVVNEIFWRVVMSPIDAMAPLSVEAAVKMLRYVWLSADLGGVKMDESGNYDTSTNSAIADGELGTTLVDILWGMAVALSRPNATDASDEWIKLESLAAELIKGHSSGEGKHPPLLSKDKLCEQLEPYVLEKLGLVEQEKDLIQRAKKLNTREIFKQSKYNLLCEEPEGFAKLRVELGGGTVYNPEELQRRVRSLIGYFELDPNRCFDLTLEALEEDPTNSALLSLFSTFRVDSLPHLLGFKYSWYCSNEFKKTYDVEEDKSDQKPCTPASLHRLTAYLLATGRLDLCSIIPHLSPSLKEMGEEQKRFEAAESKKTLPTTRSSNPLAESEMNRRLSSSSTSLSINEVNNHPPANYTTAEDSENQLIDLLVLLIEIKSWERVQELAGVIQAAGGEPARYRNVRLALMNLLEVMISPVFTSHADMTINYCNGKAEKQTLTTVPDEVFRRSRLHRVMGKPAAAQLKSDANERDNTVEADGVEDGEMGELNPASSFDTATHVVEMDSTTSSSSLDVPGALKPIYMLEGISNAIEPILSILGPWLADDLTLFFKLCRLLKEAKAVDSEGCIRIITLYLFPALSLIPSNPLASAELWKVLKDYSLQSRINVYNHTRAVIPDVRPSGGGASSGQRTAAKTHYRFSAAEKAANTATRDILKRLSRETTKENSRNIGKCLNSNPIVVMELLLSRLESYDNFIQPIVESLKYSTLLAQDITSYLIVLHLDGKRPLFASTGLTLSPWLLNISSFAGLFYKTYPGTTNYPGLLQFIEYSLQEGGEKVNYVVVLKELLHQAGGVEALEDISAVQLEGRAGGEKLRVETLNFGVVSVTSRRAARTLLSMLQSSKCAISLILLMAHQRDVKLLLNQGPPSAPTLPLKLLASQYDTLHCVLCQLIQFITTLTPLPKLFEITPPIQSLVSTRLDESGFALKREVAIALWRPLLRQSLLYGRYGLERTTESSIAGKIVVNDDLLKEWDPYVSHILPALASGSSSGRLSEHLIVSFWSLTLYDIYMPKGKYIDEIQRLQRYQTECSKQAMDRRTPSDERERMLFEAKETGNLVNTIEAESNVQLAHVRSVRKQLSAVKSQLLVVPSESSSSSLVEAASKKNMVINSAEDIASDILQSMVYPRLLMGAEDAIFAAKFCFLLHSLRAPHFSIAIFMELCLRRLVRALFGSTDHQARSIAFFLKDILVTLRRWSKDEKSFKTEAMGTLGLEELSHKTFVIKAKNWTNVLVDTLLVCLQSPEYQRVKCALVVLVVVVDVYPWHRHEGELLEKELECMCEKRPDGTYTEQRDDIRVKALSTLTVVRKQMPDMLVDPATTAAIAARQKQQKQEASVKSIAGTSVPSSVPATHTVQSAGTKKTVPADSRSGAMAAPTAQHGVNKAPIKPSATQQTQATPSIKHLPTKSHASGDKKGTHPNSSEDTASSKNDIPPTKRIKMSTSASILASETTMKEPAKLSILKKENATVKGNTYEITNAAARTKRKVVDESNGHHQRSSTTGTGGAAGQGGTHATLSALRKVISTTSSAKQQQPTPSQPTKGSSTTTLPATRKVISTSSSTKQQPTPSQPSKGSSSTALPATKKVIFTSSAKQKHPSTQLSKDSSFSQGSDHDKQEEEMRQATRDALSKSKRASMPGNRDLDDEKAVTVENQHSNEDQPTSTQSQRQYRQASTASSSSGSGGGWSSNSFTQQQHARDSSGRLPSSGWTGTKGGSLGPDRAQKGSSSSTGHGSSSGNVSTHKMAAPGSEGIPVSQNQQQGWDSSQGDNFGSGRPSASNMPSSSRQYNIHHSKRGSGGPPPQPSPSVFPSRGGIEHVGLSNVIHESSSSNRKRLRAEDNGGGNGESDPAMKRSRSSGGDSTRPHYQKHSAGQGQSSGGRDGTVNRSRRDHEGNSNSSSLRRGSGAKGSGGGVVMDQMPTRGRSSRVSGRRGGQNIS